VYVVVVRTYSTVASRGGSKALVAAAAAAAAARGGVAACLRMATVLEYPGDELEGIGGDRLCRLSLGQTGLSAAKHRPVHVSQPNALQLLRSNC
jgi:hypothetical protein